MKKIRISVALALLAAATSMAAPSGKPLEIKGHFIGMTTQEYIKLPKAEPTIGGVESKYGTDPFHLDWNEGRLERMAFIFESKKFPQVLAAVKGKYPKLKCVESQITNRLGAPFQQVECTLNQAGATLLLSRFVSDIETSVLSLSSDEATMRSVKAAETKKSDI